MVMNALCRTTPSAPWWTRRGIAGFALVAALVAAGGPASATPGLVPAHPPAHFGEAARPRPSARPPLSLERAPGLESVSSPGGECVYAAGEAPRFRETGRTTLIFPLD